MSRSGSLLWSTGTTRSSNLMTHQVFHSKNKCPTRPVYPTSLKKHHHHIHISHQSVEDLFFHAVARASLCTTHATPTTTTRSHSTNSKPTTTTTRSHSTNSNPTINTHPFFFSSTPPKHRLSQPRPRQPQKEFFTTYHLALGSQTHTPPFLPPEELKGIVDLYDFDTNHWPDSNPSKPPTGRKPLPVPVEDIPDAPRNLIDPTSPQPPSPDDIEDHRLLIEHILALLDDPQAQHAAIFEAYQALPFPRITYLPAEDATRLMRLFTHVEFRSEESMLRYLSLVDDKTAANIPLTIAEWNSAINFAGRWVRRITDDQVETATQIWLRMEREAGVQSNNVTFNILFHIASKAGKFALAHVIMKEMVTRHLPQNRYFRASKIYFHGLKRDGAAVRQAYKELVDAGEFVDTAIMNCVIASLISAGEPSAAEHIFERMKVIHAEHTGTIQVANGWRKQRELARTLDRAARRLRKQPESRKAVQAATPITPNIHTYRLLIKHHALESGNIDRVTDLLDEMDQMGIRMHGSIFFQLFRGFYLHGGVRYSSWTRSRLDKLWAIFLEFVKRTELENQEHGQPMDEEDRGCYYDSPIVIVVLRAYDHVAGKDAALALWDDIMDKWRPEGEQLDRVNQALAWIFAGRIDDL